MSHSAPNAAQIQLRTLQPQVVLQGAAFASVMANAAALLVLLVVLSSKQAFGAATTPPSQAVVIAEKVAFVSPFEERKQLLVLSPESDSTTAVRCFQVDLQAERWSWKELVWGAVEVRIAATRLGQQKKQQEVALEKNVQDTLHKPERSFFAGLVSLSKCFLRAEVNATVVCRGDANSACAVPVSWPQQSCLCIGAEPQGVSTKDHLQEDRQVLQFLSGPIHVNISASLKVPPLSVVLTAGGLLLLACAEPISRVSAAHVILGGVLGAGLAHVGVMLAIAAVPGAVVALPWIAALSAYRLGFCEAVAMLVAGYVYTVAMALALLYLYTQHFSYVQAVYLFVVFHAALAGALRAESPPSSSEEAPASPVAAMLTGPAVALSERNWLTMWVPGRGSVLQRAVYFALLGCGGALFAGTTNIWLHAAILRAHSSLELPPWVALSLSAAPVFIVVGLEIHWHVLSSALRAVLTLPSFLLDGSADLMQLVRTWLGFYVPGTARAGADRYGFRSTRRVFYSHILQDEQPLEKWGPERDFWLIKTALRHVGYWLAGVKAPVVGASLYQGGRMSRCREPGVLQSNDSPVSGNSSSDLSWSASGASYACPSQQAVQREEDEVSSANHLLPRGSRQLAARSTRPRETRLAPIRETASEGSPAETEEGSRETRAKGGTSEASGLLQFGRNLQRHHSGSLGSVGNPDGYETDASSRGVSYTCTDDREYYENVSDEGGEAASFSGAGEEWDWLTAEGLTPGEALAGQSCPVCLTLRKNLAFGCGHQTCSKCGAGLSKCPICRKRISVRVQLFH